ncbi:MAG TPA: heparan-alpha-glucosaminide N-acetyltransferase domain-containing protein, partial [Planctomycetota bacterium]
MDGNGTAAAGGTGLARILALDRLRGLAMVLMAIDHVRVYAGVPAGGPTPGVFFTRWVTHFCAPAFFFLAGTSAFLHGRRRPGLARFLVTRGLWLVLLELTLLRWCWTFNLEFGRLMAGVIWALGWCMVLLAGLVKLPTGVVAALGLVLVAGHDALDPQALASGLDGGLGAALWSVLYVGFHAGLIPLGGGASLIVLYSLVPWIGVMACGYAFGRVMTLEPERRHRLCLALGAAATLAFLVLRGGNLYGDPRPWSALPPPGSPGLPVLFSFLNTTKYPASLLFLLMTLGPLLLAVPAFERLRGPVGRVLAVFGRVPFLFYLLHIPLIHALALGVSWLREGAVNPWLFTDHPMMAPPAPEGFEWPLGLLYLVWAVAVALLWGPCRWFAGIKQRRRDAWL